MFNGMTFVSIFHYYLDKLYINKYFKGEATHEDSNL
jgi:hypothetical protein